LKQRTVESQTRAGEQIRRADRRKVLSATRRLIMPVLKVLIADDHEIVRQGLRSMLEAQRDCQVVGEAGDGRQAVTLTKELNPDVVILDIGMPTLNGLEATRQILKMRPQTKVLILTMHESDSVIREVLDAGARGYILKTDAGRDLVTAVDSLRRNKTFFTSRVSQMILDGFLKGDPRPQDSESGAVRLTPRQREIVQLLAEGKSSKEVAVALDLSVKTAETHRANIMRKLDCHSVSEVVRYAIRNKIIEA
jgi:DNA-binding NarL/FixJ family response regulator